MNNVTRSETNYIVQVKHSKIDMQWCGKGWVFSSLADAVKLANEQRYVYGKDGVRIIAVQVLVVNQDEESQS